MICDNGIALDCPCTANCPRHGKCCECVSHHIEKNNLPACLRFLKADIKKERREQKALNKQARKQGK